MEEVSLLRHLGLDLLFLLLVGIFPSLAVWSKDRRKSGAAAFLAVLGVALFVVAAAHMNLFDTLVRLPEFGWVHRLTIGVIFGVAALPVAWLASKKKVKAGWILVFGLLLWVTLFAQAVSLKLLKPTLEEEVSIRRCMRRMEVSIRLKDPGGLARNIKSMPIPPKPRLFDLVLMPLLESALFHKHPAVAEAAAQKIGERGDPGALPVLLDAMDITAPAPRKRMEKVADKLSNMPRAASVLKKVVLNGKPARRRALALLAEKHPNELEAAMPDLLRYGDKELQSLLNQLVRSGASGVDVSKVLDALAAALSSDDIEASGAAAESLAALADLPDVRERIKPEPLIKLLWSAHPSSRPAAARLLKIIGAAKATPVLLDAASSKDPVTAREAIAALATLRVKEATPIFANAISSASPSMRALGYVGLRNVLLRNMPADSPLVREIQKAASREKNPAARRVAAELLAWLDLPGAFDYADGLATSGASNADKLAAIKAFNLLGEERALPPLLALAGDTDPEIRREAVTVIGHIGDSSLLPELHRIEDDPDEAVRAAIAAAIEEVSRREPVKAPPPPTPGPFSPGDFEEPRVMEPPPW